MQKSSQIPDDITNLTTSQTSVILTQMGLRGRALGLDKNNLKEKKEINKIKDEADGEAKKIYEKIIHAQKLILEIRASEGFGRDEVVESFKSSDTVVPDCLLEEIEDIKTAITQNKKEYTSRAQELYKIENAIMDVIENTNQFVTNAGNKDLSELALSESGASSIMIVGDGVRSLGNTPDYYADTIFTKVLPQNLEEFRDNPLDPEASAHNPEILRDYLNRIAKANEIEISNLEIVLMDRAREAERLEILRQIQAQNPGMEITLIQDGTVAHALDANLGNLIEDDINFNNTIEGDTSTCRLQNNNNSQNKSNKHKVLMTVGAAPEGFFNLAVAGAFRDQGALASLRIYSKNLNHDNQRNELFNLSARYIFSKEEQDNIQRLRSHDYADILAGQKLFTQDDVEGGIQGSMAFITHSGVFQVRGVYKENNNYLVNILRFGNFSDQSLAWYETKSIS